jgi:hypothetical protein
MQCTEIETQAVCYTTSAGVKTDLVAHYTYAPSVAGQLPRIVRTVYTDSAGVPVDTTGGTVTVGACPIAAPTQFEVIGGALPFIGGPVRATEPEFAGLSNTTDTTAVPGSLHSVTVSARGVIDGPSSADTIFVDLPDGTKFYLMDGQTFTWTVARNQDLQLGREYKITATGNAYANIGYTFV